MGLCTDHYKMLPFCAKTIVIDSHKNFEQAHLKKEKEEEKEENQNEFWPFGNFLVWYFHNALSHH